MVTLAHVTWCRTGHTLAQVLVLELLIPFTRVGQILVWVTDSEIDQILSSCDWQSLLQSTTGLHVSRSGQCDTVPSHIITNILVGHCTIDRQSIAPSHPEDMNSHSVLELKVLVMPGTVSLVCDGYNFKCHCYRQLVNWTGHSNIATTSVLVYALSPIAWW